MIQIKDTLQNIYIYKSNWNYNATAGMTTIILCHDISNQMFDLDFNIIIDNINHTTIQIDFLNSGINLEEGFYTLNFYLNTNLIYKERVQYTIPIIINNIGNSSKIIDNDNYSSKIKDN